MDSPAAKAAILVMLSLLMIPLGLKLGERLKGDPKSMATLEAGDGRAIHITAQLRTMSNAELYATIQDGEQVNWDEARFARAPVMDSPPTFTLYQRGDVVAVSTEVFPEYVCLVYDFESNSGWPVKTAADEPDSDLFTRGEKLLAYLIKAGAAPSGAVLLPDGVMPRNNPRLAEQYEAEQSTTP